MPTMTPLIRKVFPSSLGALEEGSVGSFKELTRAFKARFITCSKALKLVDFLLSMAMREGKTLKTYSDTYWETYNEIDGNFENVAMRTFKVGLPAKHELKKSLTMKSTLNICQLMDRIDKYKQVEKDKIQEKVRPKCSPRRGILRGGGGERIPG